jgi:hypothetical protein
VRRWTVLLVAIAAVLGGCGGTVPGDGGGGPGSTPTLTAAPIPEDTGPSGGALLAPGLSANGVFDDEALTTAHRTELTEEGFVLVRNRTVVRPDASAPGGVRMLNTVNFSVVAEPDATAYLLTRVERSDRAWLIADGYTLISVWYRGPLVRNRFVNDDGLARYWGQNHVRSGGPILDPTDAADVREDLSTVDLRVVGEDRVGGTRVYRLQGSGFTGTTEPTFPPLLTDPHNATMTARVDERGVVRSYTLAFEATFDGGPVRIRRTHRVSEIGTATVGTPAWVTEANRSVADSDG